MDVWNGLIQEVGQQQQCLDFLTAAWRSEYLLSGGRIYCGKGCRGCCSLAVNATLTEAVAIARVVTRRQDGALQDYMSRLPGAISGTTGITAFLRAHRRTLGYCPFLESDGACGIYACRPLSCRALLSTRESRWCAIDFSEISDQEKRDFMESLDAGVVAFPSHYAASPRDTAQELEVQAKRRMADCFGFSLYGSLPAMVELVLRHGLCDACQRGPEEVAALVARAGLDHPFLLHLEP